MNGYKIKKYTIPYKKYSSSSNTKYQKILLYGKTEWEDTTWNKCLIY